MYGFPHAMSRRVGELRRSVFTAVSGQVAFALPSPGNPRFSPRVWTYDTTPPTLVNPLLYQIKRGHGVNTLVSGGSFSIIDTSLTSTENMYDGSTATQTGYAEFPHQFTVDWGVSVTIAAVDLALVYRDYWGYLHYVTSYIWEGSNDNATFGIIASVANIPNGVVTTYFDTAHPWRYYRYQTTGIRNDGIYGTTSAVRELRMYPATELGFGTILFGTAPIAGTPIQIEYVAL